MARAARHLVTTAVGSVGERGDAVLCAVVGWWFVACFAAHYLLGVLLNY